MQLILVKFFWLTLTVVSFVGATVGFILPVIPGIPFLILMIYSLRKVSPAFHRWFSRSRFSNWLRKHQPAVAKWLVD